MSPNVEKATLCHFTPTGWIRNCTQGEISALCCGSPSWINFSQMRQGQVTLTTKDNVQATLQHQNSPTADLRTGVALHFFEG